MSFGFKEILWDSGGVWILVLTMSIVWLLNTLKQISLAGKKINR
jgi:hypothetical protein